MTYTVSTASAELPAYAHFDGRLATRPRDVTTDPAALDSRGFWAVVADFEGAVHCVRFDDVRDAPLPDPVQPWCGPAPTAWTTSLDADAYRAAVTRIRAAIADGDVYQANLCRLLRAPLPHAPGDAGVDVTGLAHRLATGNPAPHAGVVQVPSHGLQVVSASPELFLRRTGRRVESGPIKGTGRTARDLTPKDQAENVMIVDLVRNDLSRCCAVGSVEVPDLCAVEEHPGLVHLVSTVSGRLAEGAGWADLLDATYPPGSVSGAPKSSALRIIRDLEPVARGPYCGAVGWADADSGTGVLAVGIRTFFTDRTADGADLCFGTGAGITWGSDPQREWEETELKAHRLIALASSPL